MRKGLSLLALARRMGRDALAISRLESRRGTNQRITFEMLTDVFEALGYKLRFSVTSRERDVR